jgi:hypothetical protein
MGGALGSFSRPWNPSHFFAAYVKNEAELP